MNTILCLPSEGTWGLGCCLGTGPGGLLPGAVDWQSWANRARWLGGLALVNILWTSTAPIRWQLQGTFICSALRREASHTREAESSDLFRKMTTARTSCEVKMGNP